MLFNSYQTDGFYDEMFDAQVRMIQRTYGIEPGEIDLPTFPLFALFDPELGMTTVLPEMDFTRPARVDPAMLRELIFSDQFTEFLTLPAYQRILRDEK